MRFIKHIPHVLCLVLVASASWAQTESEIRKNADELFEKEAYVQATPLYLQLLNLYPTDADINFRYGTCSLFNDDKKKVEAIKFLNAATQTATVDIRAFYFKGKALHLNYQFDEAKKSYQIYKDKRSAKDNRYDVDREIEMCQNGKKLMIQFTDIIVSEKTQIEDDKFFRLYNDMQSIGGDILVTERFQSKIDKKKGHIPIVHYPKNATAVYYASYGDNENSGLDIYVRKKLPDNSWGVPYRLNGPVNTAYDENFPYLHPNGRYLYFSSKGHNSMGGYDVFLARLNPESNQFEQIENVDYAICSPDDDVFYVVDSAYQNAYFASSRQSEEGKLHVYRVKVVRVPIQEIIVMGDFVSEVNPENKDITINVTSVTTGSDVGKIVSNKTGKYSFVFPKGGAYKLEMLIDGLEPIVKTIELPFLDEFRPLKQKILHYIDGNDEKVKIIDLFDEKPDGADELVAKVLREKSNLEINIDQFDVDALRKIELEAKRDELLAELGFQGLSIREVQNQLNELAEADTEKLEKIEKLNVGISNALIGIIEEIEQLSDERDALMAHANTESDPAKKYTLLSEAEQKEIERTNLINQAQALNDLKQEAAKKFGSSTGLESTVEGIESEFNRLIEAGKEEEALNLLATSKEAIEESKNTSMTGLVDEFVKETIELRKKQDELVTRNSDHNRQIELAKTRTIELESKLPNAKKKEAAEIQDELSKLDQTIAMNQKELEYNQDNIVEMSKTASALDMKIDVIQSSGNSVLKQIDARKLQDAQAALKQQQSEDLTEELSTQIAELESGNPNGIETNPSETVSATEKFRDTYTETTQRIESASKSELEKTYALITQNEQTISTLEQRLKEIDEQMDETPTNTNLGKEKQELTEFKTELEDKQSDLTAKLKTLEPSISTTVTREDLLDEIAPTYTADIGKIENDANLSELNRLEKLQEIDQKLQDSAEKRLGKIQTELQNDPANLTLLKELELINEMMFDATKAIETRSERIAEIENQTPDVAISKEDVIADLSPNYTSEQTKILSNSKLSEQAKLESLNSLDASLKSTIEKHVEKVKNLLELNPSNSELQGEQQLLDQILSEISSDSSQRERQIAALNSNEIVPFDLQITIAKLVPNYTKDLAEIDQNESLTEKERLEQKQNLDEELIQSLEAAFEGVKSKLAANPSNQQLLEQKEGLDTAISETQTRIDQREAAITQLNSTTAVVDVEATKKAVLDEVKSDYSEKISAINTSSKPEVERSLDRLKLEQEILSDLTQMDDQKRKEATNAPDNKQIEVELTAISELIIEQKETIEEQRNASLEASKAARIYEETVATADRKYSIEIGDLMTETYPSGTKIAQRESELQERLQTELETKQSTLERIYSVDVDLEAMILENEIQESKRREKEAANLSTIASTPEKDPKSEQTTASSDSKLRELEEKRLDVTTELTSLDLSTSERKELENQLKEIDQATIERKNEVQTIEIAQAQEKQDNLNNALQQLGGPNADSETVKSAIDASVEERKAIDQLLEKADDAKSIEEKNYLLSQGQDRQEKLNTRLERVVENQEIQNIEEQEGITVLSREELEKRRRGFIVEIGELEVQQNRVENQISTAKKKEIPALENEKKAIDAQLDLLKIQLGQIELRLENFNQTEPVDRIATVGLDQTIFFTEERKIAASEAYKAYKEEGVKALEMENEIRILQQDLDSERADVVQLLTTPESAERNEEIELKTTKIKELETEIQSLNTEFNEQMRVADRLLPADENEAMKMKNLLVRGVQPIKTAIVATALIQMPTTGFAIDRTGESIYSEANPIPVDVKSPSGLTYRVQVGAFSKPIPQDLFAEFNPVSGEKIGTTGITRYMAGFFNNSETVVNARETIRSLGYNDAFVVAYCDGERISLDEARRLEASGECVPKGTNELILEVAENTAEHMGIPMVSELIELPELAYNQAPGAVKADPIELKQGLFFTVQVGVFNRPVSDSEIKNLPEVLTVRLPNGLIRYSSGMFDSAEDAFPRRTEAQAKGISDAFIVAYYNGERITVARARALLEENGPSILQSNREKVKPVEVVQVPENAQRTDSVTTRVIETTILQQKDERKVQIVTKKTFEEYPRDILNRYNTEGNFYFDESDGKVKSEIYSNKKELPRLFKFENDIDTLYLSEDQLQTENEKVHIMVRLSGDKVPGDLADWLLRMGYQKKFVRTKEGLELHIEGIERNRMQDVQYHIREVGLEPFLEIELR